jgi:flagellar basal-body rod protein FlgB
MPNVYDALNNRMDFLIARQSTIAGNIANANTPGYLARDLTAPKGGVQGSGFGMMVSNARHLQANSANANGGGRVEEDREFVQHNGNSVRLDVEMLKMNETQMDYRMMTQLYAKQVSLQRLALGVR